MRKGRRAGGSSQITQCVHMAKPRTQLAKPTTSLGAVEGIWGVCLASEVQGVILVMWLALTWSMGRNSTLRLSPHSSKPYCRHSHSACYLSHRFFIGQFFHVHVYVCACIHVCVCMPHMCVYPRRPEKGVRPPEAWITGSYKLPNVDVVNLTWAL